MNEIYFKRVRRILQAQITALTKEQKQELKSVIDKVKENKNAPETAAKPNSSANDKGAKD